MHINLNHQALSADHRLEAARDHFDEHGPALINAASLIAGENAGRRVLRLITRLREADKLTRPICHELLDLHRLLMLDPAGEVEDGDYDFALLLDPAGREVEEICLLADELRSLLEVIAEPEVGQPTSAQATPLRGAA